MLLFRYIVFENGHCIPYSLPLFSKACIEQLQGPWHKLSMSILTAANFWNQTVLLLPVKIVQPVTRPSAPGQEGRLFFLRRGLGGKTQSQFSPPRALGREWLQGQRAEGHSYNFWNAQRLWDWEMPFLVLLRFFHIVLADATCPVVGMCSLAYSWS